MGAKRHALACALGITLVNGLFATAAHALDGRGELALEHTQFPRAGAQGQHREHPSVSAQIELWHSPNDGRDTFSLTPFLRWDRRDEERSHWDLRELSWVHVRGGMELRTGWRQVFWGVTEGVHLVDIINQTDAVESVDGERKLGQPMLNLALEQGDHMFDLFLLIGARERTFPGAEGRLRLPIVVDRAQTRWESRRADERLDLAARWQWNAYPLRLGLSGFSGHAREPELLPLASAAGVVLAPYYPLIHQVGVDAQITQGDLLWKLELIQRWGGREDYQAADAGLEYTQVGILDTPADLGWLLELLYDSRGRAASTPFQQDLLLGWRLAFNDAASTTLLASVILDPDSGEQLWSLEGQHRLADAWSLALELRQIGGTPAPQQAEDFLLAADARHALRPLARDSFVRTTLSWFF